MRVFVTLGLLFRDVYAPLLTVSAARAQTAPDHVAPDPPQQMMGDMIYKDIVSMMQTYGNDSNYFKYNNRELTDVERTEAAIGKIEGASLKLYKPAGGKGDSLYNRKEGEPRPDYVPPEGCRGDATCSCSECSERRFHEAPVGRKRATKKTRSTARGSV